MTDDLLAAAVRLVEVIAAENAALEAFDLPAATAMVASKQYAVESFATALRTATAPIAPDRRRQAEALGRRLAALARENRRRLEQAIAAQARVIEIIGRAGRRELAAKASRYSAFGVPAATTRPRPVAISERA